MTEKVLFKSEEKISRQEAVEKLRNIVEKVSGGELNLESTSESVKLDIPEQLEFKVKVEEENTEKSLELELEWDESEKESSGVSIS